MNHLAHRLIGLGLWMATPKAKRGAFTNVDLVALGRWAVVQLNGQHQASEMARRHAKPSSRKRIA
jgi:hypothetical protein